MDTHLSQRKIVHILGTFGAPVSDDLIDCTEHWATNSAYMKANCDATSFIIDLDWIARDIIVIPFRLENMNILSVKQCENKITICLVRFSFHNQIVFDSSSICSD